jgi:ABC-2 type transport system permease protein
MDPPTIPGRTMNTNVLCAVFRRNFVGYFASPIGYVFICVFVLLSSIAAFWPNEFFNANLANLDQLDMWFPFIMLVFIPAITMSIWAEERRQGTDELLLTIPAGDLDIVLGKYLAAVAIYSVSLLFSLVTNYAVLAWLGSPDLGLFLGTYVGYWLVGLAMLAMGMVASFLTANLTVGFVLGAVFNVPLVFAVEADSILSPSLARLVSQWSIGQRLSDFSRGVLSLSSLAYFGTIVVVMLYLSMVLIARRHWVRGRDWGKMASHYGVRTLALLGVGLGVTTIFHFHDWRLDVSSEHLSSLSPYTIKLLHTLRKDYEEGKIKQPVKIEAFISPEVPDSYVQARLNLLSVLREIAARGGDLVQVSINPTERFSEMALLAKDRFDITPRRKFTISRGAYTESDIFMGVAFESGLQKVILPFIDRGIPAEYELVRSLCTVTQQKKRKKLGVVQTDAQLFGSFNMQTMSADRDWPIIEELKKQYEVVRIDPSQPIPVKQPGAEQGEGEEAKKEGEEAKKEKAGENEPVDVLLAVQPSTLGEEEMKSFLAAVRQGQPTAIFEDPFPYLAAGVPATSQPRRQPPQMQMMMRAPMPKGDIKPLWRMLGVNFSGDDGQGGASFGSRADHIVWQIYNPYPKVTLFDKEREFVFVDAGCGASEPFNEENEISSKLQQVLFPFPGFIRKLHASDMKFTPLVETGPDSGYEPFDKMEMPTFFGPTMLNPYRPLIRENQEYVLAAYISGRAPAEEAMDPLQGLGGEQAKEEEKKKETGAEIKVVLVADIDMLTPAFFSIREQGDTPEAGVDFEFDNVTFVLNVLDYLAGDERFLELRKRRPRHRTLTRIEEVTEAARQDTMKNRQKFYDECNEAVEEEQQKLDNKLAKYQKELDELRKQARESGKDIRSRVIEIQQELEVERESGQKRVDARREEAERDRDEKIEEIDAKLAAQIRRVQDRYKLWAVLLPPIPPLLVAVGFFFIRRSREHEGVSRTRLR